MYLVHVLDDVRTGQISAESLNDVRDLPRGLHDYYQRHWRTMRAHDQDRFERVYEPVLRILATVQEPVTTSAIEEWTEVVPARIRDVIRDWRPFLNETSSSAGEPQYRIYHTSFQDFLAHEGIGLKPSHDRIAKTALTKIPGFLDGGRLPGNSGEPGARRVGEQPRVEYRLADRTLRTSHSPHSVTTSCGIPSCTWCGPGRDAAGGRAATERSEAHPLATGRGSGYAQVPDRGDPAWRTAQDPQRRGPMPSHDGAIVAAGTLFAHTRAAAGLVCSCPLAGHADHTRATPDDPPPPGRQSPPHARSTAGWSSCGCARCV